MASNSVFLYASLSGTKAMKGEDGYFQEAGLLECYRQQYFEELSSQYSGVYH